MDQNTNHSLPRGTSAGGGTVLHQLMLNGGQDPNPPFRAAIADESCHLEGRFELVANS